MVLSACGSSKDNTEASPGHSASATSSSSPAESSATPERRGSFTSSIYDRGGVPAEEGTIEDNRWTKWIIENGPADVDFKAIPRWESLDKYNVLFASGTAPDLVYEFSTSFRDKLIANKQIMPIQDLIEQYSVDYKAMLEKYPILRKIATRDDGNMYEFGRLNGLQTNHGLLIRKDWLDKLGLSVPTTADELYAVAEAFAKQDPDGNNKDDTLGMGAAFVSGYILTAMFQAVGWKVVDDKLVTAEENKQAQVEFVKKLYENGIIDKDYLTDKNGEKEKQNFITGKLGIYGATGVASKATEKLYEGLKKNVPEAQVMAIPLPRTQFGQFSPTIGTPAQATAFINAKAKDPEAIIKYIDFMVRESTQKMLKFGEEGVHYEEVNGCPAPIDQEKNSKELNWNADFQLLVSNSMFGDCWKIQKQLDPNDPIQKEFIEIANQAEAAYLSPDRPIADFTLGEYKPAFPDDLSLIQSNTAEAMTANLNKAIVSGSKYTVEQAMADNKKIWEKAGGPKVDQWIADWYDTHKDTSVMAKDLYTIFE